jgi:mannose-1-phosphate guanylyltransferase
MKALVLCAGFGTRLRPLTDNIPKPALRFLGTPMGHWSLQTLSKFGATSFVVNSHYLPEKIAEMASASVHASKIDISHEVEKPLGGGGALWHARKYFNRNQFSSHSNVQSESHSPKGPLPQASLQIDRAPGLDETGRESESIWISNGDEMTIFKPDFSVAQLLADHRSDSRLATLIVLRHPGVGTQFGGVWADSKSVVQGFGKASPKPGLTGYHFTGLVLVDQKIFKLLPAGESNLLYDVIQKGINSGSKVLVYEIEADWYETGNFKDLAIGAMACLGKLFDSKDIYHDTLRNSIDPALDIHWARKLVCTKSVSQQLSELTFCSTVFIGPGLRITSLKPGSAMVFSAEELDALQTVAVKNPTTVIDGDGEVRFNDLLKALSSGGLHYFNDGTHYFKN